jgi:uncharacterized protein DUF7002
LIIEQLSTEEIGNKMDISKFILLRPELYHLTDPRNLESILSDYTLKSTKVLTKLVGMSGSYDFLHKRRVGSKEISNGTQTYIIRDQDPLYEAIAVKNLTDGYSFSDFVFLLNSKIFFWAKWNDLLSHYARYEKLGQLPVILKLKTEELFKLNNSKAKFCRLNSGAPRCNHHHPKGAPPRGAGTFLSAQQYPGTPSSVREVTFEGQCQLPTTLSFSKHPNKPFKLMSL